MWFNGWMLLGIAAFVLVIANLARAAMGRGRGWQALVCASLSSGALALVCALQTINDWVLRWRDSELLDVEPTLTALSAWAACLGIALNLLALWLHLRRKG